MRLDEGMKKEKEETKCWSVHWSISPQPHGEKSRPFQWTRSGLLGYVAILSGGGLTTRRFCEPMKAIQNHMHGRRIQWHGITFQASALSHMGTLGL
jgi:hypothetical protein